MSAAMPKLAATVHTAWPSATPGRGGDAAGAPARQRVADVSAVSWPGVQITSAETPRNATSPVEHDLERYGTRR